MPGIELSTLSGPELRRLLKAARSRNDGPLADRLEWEIAERGAGSQRPAAPISASAQAVDVLSLEPPLPHLEAEEPTAPISWPDKEPLELTRDAARSAHAPAGLPFVGLGLVAGSVITAAVFWGLNGLESVRSPTAEVAAPRAMLARAAPDPASTPPAPAPTTQAEPAASPLQITEAPLAATLTGEPAASTEAAQPRKASPRPRTAATRVAKTEPSRRPTRLDPCARPPTPADRLVCNDLALEELDVEMREAYARALNARADPVIVGQGQTAWRRARDEVADPRALARLYDMRIRELNAATAAARSEQPPY